MTSEKVKWARKEIGKGLKAAKTKQERAKVMGRVWAEAKRRYG